MDLNNLKYLVVGSGFFGSVIAERIAEDMGERVMVVEKLNHIGRTSYSESGNKTGIEYHKYGSHIFHTSLADVWNYINRFCTFNSYRHKVLTTYDNKVYQIPINLKTINAFYGRNLTPHEAEDFIKGEIEKENIYLNIDQTIAIALKIYEEEIKAR
jgi:UDP-galactopyranose mutase